MSNSPANWSAIAHAFAPLLAAGTKAWLKAKKREAQRLAKRKSTTPRRKSKNRSSRRPRRR